MMAGMTERDRKALRLGGFGVAAVVVVWLVVFPLMDFWGGLQKRYDNAQKKINDIKQSVSQGAEAREATKKLRDKATLCQTPIDLQQQTARLMQQFQKLPDYRKITVKQMEGLPLQDQDEYYRSAVNVQFAGRLTDLYHFLHEVDQAKPTLKVERLTLTSNSKDTSKIEGQMVIAGYAVVLKGKNG